MCCQPAAHAIGSGRIVQGFTGGSVVGCYAPWRRALWRFDLCAGLFSGSVEAKPRGFGDAAAKTRGLFAPLAQARFGLLPDRFGFELSASVLAPTTRQDFAIEGAGVAYASSPIAILVALHSAYGFTEHDF